MSTEPTVLPRPPFPTRVTTTWDNDINTWTTDTNAAIASENAHQQWVREQTPAAIGAAPVAARAIPCECRLTLSGGNLLLSRCNGSRLVIDDAPQTIPLAGVTLAPTGLSANTLYYIYAAMSSGSMILEASTAVPTMDARNGIQVKTGDATRTLVGLAYPLAGPVFADSLTQRLVVSYYNRKPKALYVQDTGSRTTTSSSYVEVYTEDRLYFLTWADTAVLIGFKAAAYNPATNKFGLLGIGVDRTSGAIDYLKNLVNANSYYQMYGGMCAVSLADGYHYTSLIFASDGSASLNVSGSSPACPTENIAMIWG